MTKPEKEKAIEEFQEQIRDTLYRAFEKFHAKAYMLFFLTDTREQVSVRRLTEEEWLNKNWLKHMISSSCKELQTLAFILAFPEGDMVNVILVTEDIQEMYCYRIDPSTFTIRFESRKPYNGEFSKLFKN